MCGYRSLTSQKKWLKAAFSGQEPEVCDLLSLVPLLVNALDAESQHRLLATNARNAQGASQMCKNLKIRHYSRELLANKIRS